MGRRRSARRTRTAWEAGKLAGSIGMLTATVGLVARGSAATISSSGTDSQTAASGTISLSMPAAGAGPPPAATNRLTINASSLRPGDSVYRAVDLSIGGSVDYKSLSLDTSASPNTSTLVTDATNGLQLKIERCSTTWTESGSNPNFSYTCGGTTSTVLATRAIIGSKLSLSNLALTAGSTNHLVFTVSLPTAAPNAAQADSETVTYTIDGTPRDPVSK